MALEDLLRAERLPWFAAGGQDADVVLSSRVRLARNLLRLPFPGRANEDQLAEIRRILDEALADISTAFGQSFERIAVDALTDVERAVLIEKRLISEKFAAGQPPRARRRPLGLPGAGDPGVQAPRQYAASAFDSVSRSSIWLISRAECIDSRPTPTSTVKIPRRVAVIGPIVVPHGIALLPTKLCEGTPAAAHARFHKAMPSPSVA